MSFAGRKRFKSLVIVAVVGAIALAVVEGLYWWRHVTVTDAWVSADFTELGSGVNGRIKRIDVRKGDLVRAGQLLATMDSEVAELDVASLEADLEKARAERAQVVSELAAFRRDIADRVETLNTVLKLMAREVETLQRRRRIAEATVARNSKLYSRQAISKRIDDEGRDRLLDITSDLRDLETTMSEKRRKIVELEGSKVQEGIFQSRIDVIDRGIDILAVRLDQSQRQLRKMHIYAPIDGVVNEVFVNAGAYVEDGDRVLLLHDPAKLWIEAPVDDSVVRHVAVGQDVEIDVEAYPYESFAGTVVAVGRVTVAAVNGMESGQRTTPQIPVIVDLAATDKPLWPGIRATANIRIR